MSSKKNNSSSLTMIIFVILLLLLVLSFFIWGKGPQQIKIIDSQTSPQDLADIENPQQIYNLNIADNKLLIRNENDAIIEDTLKMGETIINEKNIFDPIHYTKVAMSPYVSEHEPRVVQRMMKDHN